MLGIVSIFTAVANTIESTMPQEKHFMITISYYGQQKMHSNQHNTVYTTHTTASSFPVYNKA